MQKSPEEKLRLAHRLRTTRTRLNLRQSDMASALGVDQATVSRIEKSGACTQKTARRVEDYCDSQEQTVIREMEDLVDRIAQSPELRALIRRILEREIA